MLRSLQLAPALRQSQARTVSLDASVQLIEVLKFSSKRLAKHFPVAEGFNGATEDMGYGLVQWATYQAAGNIELTNSIQWALSFQTAHANVRDQCIRACEIMPTIGQWARSVPMGILSALAARQVHSHSQRGHGASQGHPTHPPHGGEATQPVAADGLGAPVASQGTPNAAVPAAAVAAAVPVQVPTAATAAPTQPGAPATAPQKPKRSSEGPVPFWPTTTQRCG